MNDAAQKGRPKKSNQLIELLCTFPKCHWKGKAYLINKNQALEIGGSQFKDFVQRIYYNVYKDTINDNQIKDVSGILRATVLFESPEKQVYFRTAAISETLTFIDLADNQNTIIEVTPDGWKKAEEPEVVFFRPPNIRPLPMPTKNGNIELLKKFLNLKNESDFVLIRTLLPFILRGRPGNRGSYAALCLTGPEGSAKSTSTKILKSIVDPGTPETRTPGNDVRDLYIGAARCHVLNLDNLSHITRDYNDALCSIISGGGFARKLNYSDDEEMIFEACNMVFFNGISIKLMPDLMSRNIQIELNAISENQRKTEAELWQELEEVKPQILSAILTALSNALKEYEKGFVTPPLPRLADFGKFSIALERGNGWMEGETLEALKSNYEDGLEAIAEENPLLSTLADELQKRRRLRGTAAEILQILNSAADEKIQRLEVWPKTPAGLGNILSRQYNVLKKMGINIERGEGRDRRRYEITRADEVQIEN